MPNNAGDDMDDTPITRRELREELSATEQKFDTKLEAWGGALLHAIQQLPTRADLDKSRAEMETRFARMEQRFAEVPTRVEIENRFAQLERHVSAEIAQHTRASNEESRGQLAVIDEKYADLPVRMTRVEDHVFKPKP